MVILRNEKDIFWEALVITILVFGLGLFLGYAFENLRVKSIDNLYVQSELNLFDAKIQNELFTYSDINCESALKRNLDFSTQIYEESKILDKYENSNKLSNEIITEHKKYDILRALFWISSIKIKEKCNYSYHDLVYIYKYNNPSLDKKAEQTAFSNVLKEVKNKFEDKIILIPMAGDNNVSTISYLMDYYNITESELPIIFIDEKIKLTNLPNPEELEAYLK